MAEDFRPEAERLDPEREANPEPLTADETLTYLEMAKHTVTTARPDWDARVFRAAADEVGNIIQMRVEQGHDVHKVIDEIRARSPRSEDESRPGRYEIASALIDVDADYARMVIDEYNYDNRPVESREEVLAYLAYQQEAARLAAETEEKASDQREHLARARAFGQALSILNAPGQKNVGPAEIPGVLRSFVDNPALDEQGRIYLEGVVSHLETIPPIVVREVVERQEWMRQEEERHQLMEAAAADRAARAAAARERIAQSGEARQAEARTEPQHAEVPEPQVQSEQSTVEQPERLVVERAPHAEPRQSPGREREQGVERERVRKVLDDISVTARGTARIHTDLPVGTMVKVPGREAAHGYAGFVTFGDGAFASRLTSSRAEMPPHFTRSIGRGGKVFSPGSQPAKGADFVTFPEDIVEAVAFVPAGEPIREQVIQSTREVKTFFGTKKVHTYMTKETGFKPEIGLNPLSGDEEEMVYFDYNYGQNLMGWDESRRLAEGLPKYAESAGGRGGNMLTVRVKLPKSVAAELKGLIEEDPGVAREAVERIVMDLGGVSKEAWEAVGRPPYKEIPEKFGMHLLEPSEHRMADGSMALEARKLKKRPRATWKRFELDLAA